MSRIQWTDADVFADWNEKTYRGQVADETWNGFAVPRFSSAVADEIVRDQAALVDEFPGDTDRLTWVGDNIAQDSPEGERVAFYMPDDDGMYSIGAWNWTWTIADPLVVGGVTINDRTMDETGRFPVGADYYDGKIDA